MISLRWYCTTDADGHERDVRWLHAELPRCYVEAGKWGVDARLGPVCVTVRLDRSPEEEE